MSRKISHIILSVLLLVSTIGLAVSKHYCGGRLVSVSLFHEAKSCCDMPGCCHNESHFYQVNDDFSVPQIADIPTLAEFDLFGLELFNEISKSSVEVSISNIVFVDISPPRTIQQTLSLNQFYLL